MTSSSDSSDGSSTDYEDRDQEARRHEKYLNSFMDEDQEDDFKEYTTKTKSKCWTSFQDFVEKIITNPTYHKIFLLLVVIDTTLVYTELLIGMMAENLDTCDCPNACEDWCLLPPEIPTNSTESTRFLQTLPFNGSDESSGNECCKYQRLLQTWIRMGYTTFALLSLFFIETIVKLTALPHLLSRKMEIADAMLVIVSWIMCFIIVFTLEEPDCEGDGGDSGGNLNGMKGVVMLTFRMLRIFNGLAMLFANFFEGKIRRYQEKIKFQTQMLNQSQEEKKRLATTAQKILRDKQNLQLQLQAVTMSYNQATQQNQPPPRGPPPAGGSFQQPARMLALPTVHSPIPGGNTDDEALENLIEHEITAAESALASNSTRVTEINDTEILRENPPSFLPPIAQGTGPSVIITPPYVPVSKSPRRSKKKDEKATLEVPQENSPHHRNTNPFDQD
ncbi:Oidioi.mRNA.OKI2018_I69.chr2.g5152.t1.cds [Oikopleura dioica]|uniref:Oidioi.mRNA.OKI2018_I69.chr2.g5152.t1.cds n=1 Tax=Oikopleura dioica TaxID=34765 RepID=A0ABN7T003_OIKDI|nr:Oidioi.mRNA.OKI2018_I69.chr2.g5152.t1.cds [Oikopleura dioica]